MPHRHAVAGIVATDLQHPAGKSKFERFAVIV